jgi:protein-disulfide isomerase
MSRSLFTPIAVLGVALACGSSTPEPPPKSFRDLIVEKQQRALARPDSFTPTADRGRILGDSAAQVWVVFVGDFQCAECKRWHDEVFPLIRKEYVATGRVRLAFLNMPQPAHLNAMTSALAAGCASVQGRFWETYSKIFDTQNNWKNLPDARPYLDSLAIGTGADAAKLRFCTEAAQATKLINTDVERNKAAGVDSVPTFFVGARKLVGYTAVAKFRAVIDSALAGK